MGSYSAEKKAINLLWGKPAPSLLPTAELAGAAQTIFSDSSISAVGLQYGDNAGYEPLRHQVSSWLASFYNCPDRPENICITGGASQSLSVILQVLTDPLATKAIWMIVPCFYLACRMFEDAGLTGKLRAVRESEEGIDIEFLEKEIIKVNNQKSAKLTAKPYDPYRKTYSHILFAVPTFSNPSGKTMPLSCRQHLVALARKFDALIITDDIYDCLQWSSSPSDTPTRKTAFLPRLVDIDRSLPPLASDPHNFGHTLSNGSFSKIIAPGMRTGWVDANPALIYAISQCGATCAGGCPSQLSATMIAQFLKNGDLQRHVFEKLIPAYRNRRNLMVDAIETHLGPLGVELSKISLSKDHMVGGYFLWMRLPEGVMSRTVAKICKQDENLTVSPGWTFGIPGDEQASFEDYLRVCFAWEDEADLAEGIVRLGRVVRRILKKGEMEHSQS